MFKYLQHIPINNRPIINRKWYIKISIASNVAIKYKGDTPIKYYGDV